jgi:mannose-6-phosphate isomerase
MVHSLGAGLVIAEIQQSSDVTFRLFDWNRLEADGQPRPLHVREALDAINYKFVGIRPQAPRTTKRTGVERLVECDKFVPDRWRISEPQQIEGDGRFHILSVLEGAMNVGGDACGEPLKMGQTMLLPAALSSCRLEPLAATTFLDIYLP